MKTYFAAKPCKFADKEYQIGEAIPVEVIDPNRINVLLKFGTIKETEVDEPAAAPKKTQAAGTGKKNTQGKKVE